MVFGRRHKGARERGKLQEAAGGYRKASWHISPVLCSCSPGKGFPLCNSCALQVIQEYVALLKLGHMLVFETPDAGNSPSAGDVDCSLTTAGWHGQDRHCELDVPSVIRQRAPNHGQLVPVCC